MKLLAPRSTWPEPSKVADQAHCATLPAPQQHERLAFQRRAQGEWQEHRADSRGRSPFEREPAAAREAANQSDVWWTDSSDGGSRALAPKPGGSARNNVVLDDLEFGWAKNEPRLGSSLPSLMWIEPGPEDWYAHHVADAWDGATCRCGFGVEPPPSSAHTPLADGYCSLVRPPLFQFSSTTAVPGGLLKELLSQVKRIVCHLLRRAARAGLTQCYRCGTPFAPCPQAQAEEADLHQKMERMIGDPLSGHGLSVGRPGLWQQRGDTAERPS